MAFFSSLTFTGTRVGGQRERQTQAFEAGVPYFPRDYPFNQAYDAYADKTEEQTKGRWDRKPPAKRVNYDKMGTPSPWRADWKAVLGMKNFEASAEADDGGEGLLTTQRDEESEEMAVEKDSEARPWLLRGPEVATILSNLAKLLHHAGGLLLEMNRLRLKRGQDPFDAGVKADALLKGALVTVRLNVCARGAPDDLALIYSMSDGDAKAWTKMLTKDGKARLNTSITTPEEIDVSVISCVSINSIDTVCSSQLSEVKPPITSIIGYVTTGHFSLSRGEGFGVAAIPLTRLLDLQQQAQR